MSTPSGERFSLEAFWAELKRRKVVRAGLAYAGAAFVLLQAADLTLPSLGLQRWFPPLLTAVLMGFPIVLLLAWLFEWKHGRISRTAPTADVRAMPALNRYAAALVIIFAIGIPAVVAVFALQRARTDPDDTRVAVLPLRAAAGAPQYLADGFADLLTRALDGAGPVRTVPTDLVRALIAEHPPRADDAWFDVLDENAAIGAYISGSLHATGGRMRVDVAWHERAADDSVHVWRASVEDDTLALFNMVDRVASELLERRFARGASEVPIRIAARTTTSLAALKEFLVAESALREGRFNEALAGFERAIAADTTFSVAYYRAALTSSAAFGPGTTQAPARRLADRAVRHAVRLPERDRRMVHALAAYRAGRPDEAEALYRALLRDNPNDLEAMFGLANVLFVYNPSRGRPAADSRPLFERVLEADPEFLCPI